ncbi:hypothetical protein BDZ91DRAFT_285500 [Kalaharituber pfeilii]|nr:hypothetical protein BDZ91DRAFT_285500 [Kalaharituber pfeilii]
MISIETPLPLSCLLCTSNSRAAQQTATMSLSARVGLNQVVSVCSFRVCCWYECSPFASRHLHCWRPMNLNRLLIYF